MLIMKNKIKILLVALCGFWGVAGVCSADTLFSDNFNSYVGSSANLNGQGNWVATSSVRVVNSPTNEGAATAFISSTGAATKSGTSLNDGQITVYVRRHIGGTTNPYLYIALNEGSNNILTLKTGGLYFKYWDGTSYVNFGPSFTSDAWVAVQIQWSGINHKVRYNINGGSWTPWVPALSNWLFGINTLTITGGDGSVFFDTIQENLINAEKIPVIIIPGILGSAKKDGTWVIDPILHIYDNLIDSFVANGYVQDETLFEFPYDWHQSNVDTATELKDKINQVKDSCGCSKVDLVAHSMGGLVARQYIESGDYQDDVNKLVFLGTPQMGAPKDYLTWEGGKIGTSTEDQLLEFYLSREAKKNGYTSLFDYIRNKPISSVQELLPIYNYLIDSDPLALRHYPDNYPTNPFLENLNNNLPILNSSNVGIYNIIGDSQDNSTINYIRVVPSEKLPLWEDGYPEGFSENVGDRGLSLGAGDGTVPTESSSIFENTVSIYSDHSSLPTNAESLIFNYLLGDGQYNTVNNFHLTNIKLLIIKLLSPVDMQVIAPDGRKIGKDFDSNQEINEIPYAFYSGFTTDDEYVTIINPEEGQYKVVTQGTSEGGEYTVSSALISDDQTIEKDFTAHTTANQMEKIDLDLSLANGEINIQPEDMIPPQITVNSPQNKDYVHSDNFNVSYTSTDDSGTFSSSAKMDNMNINNGQNVDLFYQQLGNHNLTVQAEDNVNNQVNVVVNFRITATVDSTISDINRAYELGWISDKSTRDDLIDRINKAVKLITLIQYVEQQVGDETALQAVETVEKKLDITFGNQFLTYLQTPKSLKSINQQAYDLIYSDINWLINN